MVCQQHFYVTEKADFHFEGDTGTKFSNNCYYGDFRDLPKDAAAVFDDPQFVDVTARGNGFAILKNFMLKRTSPCKDAGINLETDDVRDLFGNPLEGKTNIGVHEF